MFVFFKQKTAYEMRISDWSSDVCSSDLGRYAIGEGMTLSLAARADQRSLFVGLTSIVQRTVFFALAAAAPHASIVSRLSRARLAAEIGRASCRERVCQYV